MEHYSKDPSGVQSQMVSLDDALSDSQDEQVDGSKGDVVERLESLRSRVLPSKESSSSKSGCAFPSSI
jgi:hypothetical protein